MRIGKAHTVCGQSVNVGSIHTDGAVTAYVTVSKVIDIQNDDVWAVGNLNFYPAVIVRYGSTTRHPENEPYSREKPQSQSFDHV